MGAPQALVALTSEGVLLKTELPILIAYRSVFKSRFSIAEKFLWHPVVSSVREKPSIYFEGVTRLDCRASVADASLKKINNRQGYLARTGVHLTRDN